MDAAEFGSWALCVSLEVPEGLVGDAEAAREALAPDDYSGLGVVIESRAGEGLLVYILCAAPGSIRKLKSLVNEIVRLLSLLQEASRALRAEQA